MSFYVPLRPIRSATYMIRCSKWEDHVSASMDDHKEHLGKQQHNISLSAAILLIKMETQLKG